MFSYDVRQCVIGGFSALTFAILADFDEIWHRRMQPDRKDLTLGVKTDKGIPYIYLDKAHDIGTYIMHFQWEC